MSATMDVVDRVERLCRLGLNAKPLREQVLAALRRVVPFDGHVFVLTDPATRVAVSPLADIPGLRWDRLPSLIRWRYLTPLNRWDVLLDDDAPSRRLLEVTDGDPSRSAFWRAVQRELGVIDTLSVPFGDRYGCWGMLDLWRTSAPFTSAEARLLESLRGAVTAGLRAVVAATFASQDAHVVSPGPVVVLLDDDLSVAGRTEAAAMTLLRLNPPDEPMPPVPAAAYNIGAAVLAAEAGNPVGEPWARVHLGADQWLTAKGSRIAEHQIAVSIELSSPAERMDLFSRAHAFSAREVEVLGLLARGLDSREIASALVLSEHTVHDHVKSMLAKAGVRTRQALVSRALGG